MRRLILAIALSAAACAQEEPPTPKMPNEMTPGIFAGRERDGLCIMGGGEAQQRAGFIIYGEAGTNCSAGGKIDGTPGRWALVPDGEGACRIPLTQDGGLVTLGRATADCAYYCAPGVTFDGKSFTRIVSTTQLPTDVAGDPLC